MTWFLKRKESIVDVVNLIAGILLFVAPWVLGYAAERTAAWTSWASGVVVAAMALIALARFAEWEEWVEGALGAWMILSPWAIGFTTISMAMYAHIVLGFVVLVAAIGEIRWLHMHHGATAA